MTGDGPPSLSLEQPMGRMVMVYGLIVGALVLVYLMAIWFLMRLSRRKEQRRMEAAQEALADGTLHRSPPRRVHEKTGHSAPIRKAEPHTPE